MPRASSLSQSLALPRSAVFLKRRGIPSRSSIIEFFEKVLRNVSQSDRLEFDIRRRRNSFNGSHSLAVFRAVIEPTFMRGSALRDHVHGFLLLIELDDICAVFSKHVGSIDQHLPSGLERVGYDVTLNLFSGADARYESISLRSLGAGRGAILRRSFDAADLTAVMPRAGARRSAATAVKVRRNAETARLSPGSGRVSSLGSRVELDDLYRFVIAVKGEIDNPGSSPFLNNFAQPIRLDQRPGEIVPTSVLFHWNEIEDEVRSPTLHVRKADGTLREANSADYEALRALLCAELEVAEDANGKLVVSSAAAPQVATLRVGKTRISLASEHLARYALVENDEETSLERYLSAEQAYSVVFSDPSYVYSAASLFRNRRLPDEVTGFLSCFTVLQDLEATTSEKGRFVMSATDFDEDSVFGVIEKFVGTGTGAVVLCDDLGDEWADHIVLRQQSLEVEFIHSKWKDGISSSASAFHELASQGTKNLGNLTSPQAFREKCGQKWQHTYNAADGTRTQIRRIRSNHTHIDCADAHDDLRGRIATRLTMSLVAPFLSKTELQEHADDFGRGRVRANVAQLVWILASFIDICRANNVIPNIYCCE